MDAAVAATLEDDAADRPWVLPEGWCWTELREAIGLAEEPQNRMNPTITMGQSRVSALQNSMRAAYVSPKRHGAWVAEIICQNY